MGVLPHASGSMDLRILPSDGREGRRCLWGRVELIGSMMRMIEFRGWQLKWNPQWKGPWENGDGRRSRQSQGDIRKNGKKKRIWFLGGGLAISTDGDT